MENLQLRIESGGFVIDYIPKGETTAWRMAFGFNELGMWVESNRPLAASSQEG
jgi:hypothetical protein